MQSIVFLLLFLSQAALLAAQGGEHGTVPIERLAGRWRILAALTDSAAGAPWIDSSVTYSRAAAVVGHRHCASPTYHPDRFDPEEWARLFPNADAVPGGYDASLELIEVRCAGKPWKETPGGTIILVEGRYAYLLWSGAVLPLRRVVWSAPALQGLDSLRVVYDPDPEVVLYRSGAERYLPLAPFLDAEGDFTVEPLDAQVRGGYLYLLLHGRGVSRPGAPSGYCGAGEEENLVWLEFTPSFRLLRQQSELIASCLGSFEPDTESALTGSRRVELSFTVTADKQRLTLLYDRRHPEEGIRVQEEDLDPSRTPGR